MKKILLDSGFWIALYNPEKEPARNEDANAIADLIIDQNICIPWPTMYEFLNSRFSRREGLYEFKKTLSRVNTTLIEDRKYKDQALSELLKLYGYSYTDISLVDEVLKQIMIDKKMRIDFLISFDESLLNFAVSHGIKII